MDEQQQPNVWGPPQPGDLPGFLSVLAELVAQVLQEAAEEHEQQPAPPNVVQLRRRNRKRSAS